MLELVNELIDELDLVEDAVVAKATDHIHANELVLTLGLSQTTLKFLLKAAERRSFQVWHVHSLEEPALCGHEHACAACPRCTAPGGQAAAQAASIARGRSCTLTLGRPAPAHVPLCGRAQMHDIRQQADVFAGADCMSCQHARAQTSRLQVVVAEGGPQQGGLVMAQELSDAGVSVLVIPDACVFAMMARVNKVLVGARAVLATGGVLAQAGTRLVALAAKHHSVPVVVVTGARAPQRSMHSARWWRRSDVAFAVCTRCSVHLAAPATLNLLHGCIGACNCGRMPPMLIMAHGFSTMAFCAGLYKLSPLFPHDPFVLFGNSESPSAFAPQGLKSSALRVDKEGQYVLEQLQYPCPVVDYVESEVIDLLITDSGGLTPSYIYRLLSEFYTRDDYLLSKELLDRLAGH